MSEGLNIRPAREDEYELLDEMTLAGVRHWGHHMNFPEAYRDLAEMLQSHPPDETRTVHVVESGGEVVAFYDIKDHGSHVELMRMFQEPERIGTGLGRVMWDHATASAKQDADRMLIMSDPGATGFYEAMGAVRADSLEVSPGFVLGVYWFELS